MHDFYMRIVQMNGNGLQNVRNKRNGFYQKNKKGENNCRKCIVSGENKMAKTTKIPICFVGNSQKRKKQAKKL